jgi:hypothetical protein
MRWIDCLARWQVIKQHGSCEMIIAGLRKQVANLEEKLDQASKEQSRLASLIDALRKQVR